MESPDVWRTLREDTTASPAGARARLRFSPCISQDAREAQVATRTWLVWEQYKECFKAQFVKDKGSMINDQGSLVQSILCTQSAGLH